MGEDVVEPIDTGEVISPDDPCRGALTLERRAAIVTQITALGQKVAGPNPAELVGLIEQIAIESHKYVPAAHESHTDFVPSQLRVVFDDAEQECRRALRKLIKEAKSTSRLIRPSLALTSVEIEPFACALMRLCELPIDGALADEVLNAIQLLADLNVVLTDSEKPGTRPIYNQCRASARATYYYRARHGLPLTINFDYLDRIGKPGTRSRPGELEPMSPTVILANEVIHGFNIAGDAAEVQTHLRKYKRQLKKEGREPLRTDFILDLD